MTPLLRVTEAATLLRVSKSEVYKLVSLGRLSHLRVGTRVLFTPEQIEQFIASATVRAVGGGA